MEFWGIEVKPGQTVKCEAGDKSIVHLSQASLGEIKKEKGSEYVPIFVKFNDQKLVIGNLSADKCAQIQYDLIFEKEFELSHGSKNSSVFFVGYKRDSISDDGLHIDEGANDIAYKNKFGKLIAEKASASKDDNVAAKLKANLEKPKKELVKADKKVEDKDSENDSNEDDDEDYEDEDDDKNDSDEDSDKDKQIIESSGDGSEEDEDDSSEGELSQENLSFIQQILESSGDGSEEDEDDSSEEDEDDSSEEENPREKARILQQIIESSGDSSEEDEDDSSEEATPREKARILQQIIESSGDSSEEDDDSSDEETPQEKKRKADSASKTPIFGKKAKVVTPVENHKAGGDGKKAYVHVLTPYPAKQGGKPQPSSKFNGSLAFRTCNWKSKHGNTAKKVM